MDLVYFVLTSFGLTQILTYGKVLKAVRPKNYFFHCSMCMGFWVGVFLLGINKYTELFSFDYSLTNAFLLGCLSSGTSYMLCQVFGDNGIKVERREKS